MALIELKLHWNYLVIVPDTEYNYEVQYLILVSTKTVDNVEGALWLATQSPITFTIHLRAKRAVFAPENIVIVAGINESK